MKPTAPENFDGDAAIDRLDPTWKAQVNLSWLDRLDSTGLVVSRIASRLSWHLKPSK